MSHDYYLICPEKKIYMPLFTVTFGGCSLISKNWMFDFISACEGEPIELISEHSDKLPEEEDGWTFMNAWHPHEYDKKKGNDDE